VDRIHMAQDGNQWHSLVNALMTFRFHKRWDISWPAEQIFCSQEGLLKGFS
jgi:hypothetical protein